VLVTQGAAQTTLKACTSDTNLDSHPVWLNTKHAAAPDCCLLQPNSSAASWPLWGSPGRAPSAVHLHAATAAPSCSICCGRMPVMMPYSTVPMNASPAPVVSATEPGGRPAADATMTCAATSAAGPTCRAAQDRQGTVSCVSTLEYLCS
jgi:hypothetical protein